MFYDEAIVSTFDGRSMPWPGAKSQKQQAEQSLTYAFRDFQRSLQFRHRSGVEEALSSLSNMLTIDVNYVATESPMICLGKLVNFGLQIGRPADRCRRNLLVTHALKCSRD